MTDVLTDEQILKMDIPEETMKLAQDNMEMAKKLYSMGVTYAEKLAKSMDEEKKEEGEEGKKKMSEEEEKKASAMSRFVEKGMFETLVKLGKEKHDNTEHYIRPYVNIKVAGLKELAGK